MAATSDLKKATFAESAPIAWKYAESLLSDGTDTPASRCEAAERATRSSQETREPSDRTECSRCASTRSRSASLGKADPRTASRPLLSRIESSSSESPATTCAEGSGNSEASSASVSSPLPTGSKESESAS